MATKSTSGKISLVPHSDSPTFKEGGGYEKPIGKRIVHVWLLFTISASIL